MSDGLKLTIPGKELPSLLARLRHHEQRAEWWTHQQTRTPEDQTDAPLLPEHMCSNQAAFVGGQGSLQTRGELQGHRRECASWLTSAPPGRSRSRPSARR